MIVLSWICLALSAGPLLMASVNMLLYRRPKPAITPVSVSVLIPARNEERNIRATVESVLASQNVSLDLVVLDDASSDSTAAILSEFEDHRLRVAQAAPLPAGWCGKQHTCATLAKLARHELMVFMDADVRLGPDALSRMAGFMQTNKAALASGFPRQITTSLADSLILPLMHFLLLGFLPIVEMRRSVSPALGAGCGQLFITRRAAYEQAGGHTAIRASLHDGLTLPRAFRRAGLPTDLFDANDFASCRMYGSAQELWQGLGKNATEGMATLRALPIWTVLLFGGQVLPAILLIVAPSLPVLAALTCMYGLRFGLAWRFGQSKISALLHPLAIIGLLLIQYSALLRQRRRRPALWRGRAYPAR